jgi:hypothetical protein
MKILILIDLVVWCSDPLVIRKHELFFAMAKNDWTTRLFYAWLLPSTLYALYVIAWINLL